MNHSTTFMNKKKFYILSTALFSLFITSIYLVLIQSYLIVPTFISVANILLILYIISLKAFKHPIYKIFFLWHSITLMFPLIIMKLFYSSNDIQYYIEFYALNESSYIRGNSYILLFDVILILVILMLSTFKSKKIKSIFNFYLIDSNIYSSFIVILFISYGMKIYLITIGAWFIYDIIDLSLYPYSTYAKLLSQLDIIPLLFFAYKKWRFKYLNRKDIIFIITIVLTSGLFALISASKAKVIIILIPIVMILFFAKYKKIYISLTMVLLFFMPIFFNFMLYLRLHSDSSINESITSFLEYERTKKISNTIQENTILGRFDYQKIVAVTVVNIIPFPNEYKTEYLDNFVSLIPRFLWRDKPRMGLDQNQAGIDIGVISRNDSVTSIGLSPVGEAYYELGFIGVLIIPIFMGIILFFMSRLLNYYYWPGFLLTFFVALMIGKTNTTVLIPSLLKLILIFYIFAILINNKYISERKLRFKF